MQPACEDVVRAFTQDIFLKLPGAEAAESYWVPTPAIAQSFVQRLKQKGYKLKDTLINNDVRTFILTRPGMRLLLTVQPYSTDVLRTTLSQNKTPPRTLLTFQSLRR